MQYRQTSFKEHTTEISRNHLFSVIMVIAHMSVLVLLVLVLVFQRNSSYFCHQKFWPLNFIWFYLFIYLHVFFFFLIKKYMFS